MQTHSLRIEGYLHGCFSEQHIFPIILPLRYLVCLTQVYAPDLLCSECKQSMIRKSEFRRRTEQSVIKQVEISVTVELKKKEKKETCDCEVLFFFIHKSPFDTKRLLQFWFHIEKSHFSSLRERKRKGYTIIYRKFHHPCCKWQPVSLRAEAFSELLSSLPSAKYQYNFLYPIPL